jgi:translocation and assembly module TamB
MRGLRGFLVFLAGLVLLVLLVLAGVCIGLNTRGGRSFAERESNRLLAPGSRISGLSGHFPADIRLATLTLADSGGVWLKGRDLELRWQPALLLRGDVDVTALSAAVLDVARLPVAGKSSGGGTAGGFSAWRVEVARLSVPELNLGAALAGAPTRFSLTGAAHFKGVARGGITLKAMAQQGGADYTLDAGMDRQTVSAKLHVSEPPDGLLAHLAGVSGQGPLRLDATLAGPRGGAALRLDAALGGARLSGTGTLGLDPQNPRADVVFKLPALAPVGALAGQVMAGSATVHLVVAQQGGGVHLALSGATALTAGPYGVAKLTGPAGQFSLEADLRGKVLKIARFDASGAAFKLSAAGRVAPDAVDLKMQVSLPRLGAFFPGISGSAAGSGRITGAPGDFAAQAVLTGNAARGNIPSGPFSIVLDARHLPQVPVGTLTATGALENAPLVLDAAFSRDAKGVVVVTVSKAAWRSLEARADLALAPGAALPTGTATLRIGRLEDVTPFLPRRLSGRVAADFSYSAGSILRLKLDAQNLVAARNIGAVDATLSATGPAAALAVRGQASTRDLGSAPARMALAGVVDLDTRTATLAALSASWRQAALALRGPAVIEAHSGVTVRHLALDVNGGRAGLDGTLTPRLNARLMVANLPVSLAGLFVPGLKATGTLAGSAALSGSLAAPEGQISFSAQDIKLHSGPAAAMPAAALSGTATVAGQSVRVKAALTAGADMNLAADGLVPLGASGALNLHVAGRVDLRLLDPLLAARDSLARGMVTADMALTGTPGAPRATGSATLAGGSVQDIGTGLNLTHMTARLAAAGRMLTLQSFEATAGAGRISGQGTLDLGAPDMPVNMTLDAANASPIASDNLNASVDAALALTGALRGQMLLAGNVDIKKAEINLSQGLPPRVADLPIVNEGAPPPPPPTPPPDVALDLRVSGRNQIFVRGAGVFAELGGRVQITGTLAAPNPQGGFELIRGYVALTGKTLNFTKGSVSFNGAGFMPALDLEASSTGTGNSTATLIVGGTAAKPVITLSSVPPLPSDEIMAQLLFGQSTTSLSPFQTASLAAALAQLSGLGGGLPNPLDSVRGALGLSQLSLSSNASGPPSVEAGRYVAPGVYLGAAQATNGQGTQATVEINLTKGLKLQTSTGTSRTGNSSSVGLSYQFNY